MREPVKQIKPASPAASRDYSGLVSGVSELLAAAHRASARTVNAFMTATYWEVGRRIVEFEQGGENRAEYGKKLVEHLSKDLTRRFGRGFGQRNVECMRQFFLVFPTSSVQARLSRSGIPQTVSAESAGQLSNPRTPSAESPTEICQTPSGESANAILSNESGEAAIVQTPSAQFNLADLARAFPLPWSQYVLLVQRSRSSEAFDFYHTEALRGGWSVRPLQRQMDSQFYERTALSRNKAAMLAKGARPQPGDAVTRLRQSILQKAFTGELL